MFSASWVTATQIMIQPGTSGAERMGRALSVFKVSHPSGKNGSASTHQIERSVDFEGFHVDHLGYIQRGFGAVGGPCMAQLVAG